MDIDFSPLYNPTFIEAYMKTIELIDEVAGQLVENDIKVKWNKISNTNGHFFYINNPSNIKENISFGIWDELWIKANSPLSISIETETYSNEEFKTKIADFISNNNLQGVSIFEYEEYVNIIFNEEFLMTVRYAREVIDLILSIARELNYNLNYNFSHW